jgi:hypothetical protein
MEFEGRSTDLSGQIHCVVGFLLLAAGRWWQVVWHGRMRSSRIPPNKVRIGGLKREYSGQTLLRVVDFLFAVVLPWWKTKMVMARSTAISLNKVCVQSLSYCESSPRPPPLARGGSPEFDGRWFFLMWWLEALGVGELISMASEVLMFSCTCCGCFGRRRKAVIIAREIDLSWSSDTKICGALSVAFDCRPTLMANCWPMSSDEISDASSTSRRRPCSELVVVFIVNSESSGDVPGVELDGCNRSSLYHSYGGGPDCFLLILLEVYFVIVGVFSDISALSDVPTVTCTRRFEK